ncbi:hypothetical protein BH23ACT9_BH23ACT9_36530 [soil metagenome]
MIALVLLLAVLSSACGRAGGEVFQPTLNTPLVLEAGRTVGQTFNPVGGTVAAVDLHVATFDTAVDPDGVLTVVLRDADSREVLDLAQVPGSALGDAAWVRAAFDEPVPVEGVAVAEVSWVGASPVALWANVAPPELERVGIVNDPYRDGQLVLDGVPTEGDLAFRVAGEGRPAAAAQQAVEVVRSAAARMAAEPMFAVLWVLAMAGAGALALTGLRRHRPSSGVR